MNSAENEPQEIDGTTREGQKQQVVVASSDLFHHQLPRKQEAAGVDSSWATQNVNDVGGRGESGGTYQRPDPSEAGNETELLNHHVAASSRTIYLTADGNGEVHLGTTGEAEVHAEEDEDSRRRRKNFTMRDPQESHHRLPLGEVESGDDSDCVVVAAPSERKVEPLKINLARDREPIRTIIKLTPGTGGSVLDSSSCSQQLSPTIREVPGSPKITIKPPKPPPPSTMEGPGGGGAPSSSSSSSLVGGANQNSNSVLSLPSTSTTALPNSSSIPKLTIKPVINPAEELLTVEAPAEQMQIIPKLLIKGSSLDASIHGVTEPHIVPKLTIRGVNNHNHHFHHHNHQHHPPESQSQSTGDSTGTVAAGASASGSSTTPSTPLVPKLTIKMDNHHPHHHPHVQQSQQHNNLRMKDVADAGGGGSGNRVESPIPKLHIKAILPEAGGSCSTQSPPSVGGSGSNILATASGSGNSLTSSEGVKLTIKPLPEPKLPKLTIKTTGLGTIAETSDASMVSSTSCSFSPKMMPAGNSHDQQHHHHHHHHHQQHNQIQLLAVAQQQPASPSDQHSNISSSSIPKITIKPIPAKLGLQQQQQSPTGSAAGNAASMGGADLPQTIPKLTIKPIPPPSSTKQSTGEDSNSSSETSINSLESSPVSSSCSSSSVATSAVITTSPSALRMTIKVSPQQDASSAGTTSGSTVTKLNIKPILPPPFPNPTGDANEPGADEVSPPSEGEVDPSAAPIVIPKVTIKTLANPRSQETEILSTPKVTLKPIPKPTGHELQLPGSPAIGQSVVEKHSPQAQAAANSIGHAAAAAAALTSNNSPTAGMTASDGGGSMDSPRIILKINKGSSSTTTTSLEQQQQQPDGMDTTESSSISHPPPTGGSSILANELKRPAGNAAANSIAPFSSSSSSASSTTVSISTSSSSAGSDPASPSSSAGGGDQGEPGSPEAKKSKLELVAAGVARVAREQQQKFIPHQLSEHNAALRQSLLENHQQQQQQLLQKAQQQQTALVGTGGQPPVADVIVIDDDSKSENESSERGESEKPPVDSSHVPKKLPDLNLISQDPASLRQQPIFAFMSNNEATTIEVVKPRRTRGTSRGAGGGRQSRRGAGGGRGAVAKQQPVVTDEAPRLKLPEVLVNHDDNDEGSSSDCMIVDDPSAATTTVSSVPTVRSGLSLESLLLGGGGIKQPVLYNTTHAGGGSNELEKNGTASNSSIGSVSSSIGSTPIPASPATATPGIRMSTRRGAGQLLKEVLANKHHDRDSGVDDEARTDGESGPHHGGPTPSKRPRGRPKKQSVDLTMETNGNGGSSSSLEGNGAGGGGIPDSNMMMALAMMSGGAGGAEGVTFLRPDGPGMLGTQQLLEGIMPLPITPVRTPRTRGRGRGRGRGKLALLDGATVAQSPNLDPLDASRRNFALPQGVGGSGGNGDPLFIDPASDPTSFNLLFNHAGTPRGTGSVRTRGGRRGVGSRGARTPRGGGRGAAKAARAALALADTPVVGQVSPEANEEGIVEPSDPLESPKSQPSGESSPTGRGRARAPRGTGTAGKRNATASGRKAPRGKKAQEAAALLAAAEAAASPKNAINPANASNTIFMTPMAGGLDLNRPKLHVRELKTPKNAIKSNTPPSSAQTTPLAGPTPAGTPGETTPGDGGLQVFEEDTRMSGDFNFTTPVRLMMSSGDGCLQPNEESQSSYLSSTSVTQDATGASATGGQPQPPAGAADGLVPASASSTSDAQKDSLAGAISAGNSNSSSSRRPKGKMEVLDAHRAAFTVELLAEYEWPPPSPGTRGTDTFMLQEQIAEYLGVKSFKRKYPDLMRRPVDMEERNFLLEQGLASEKMCDLGLTAVYASEILDIMCSDYPEKYEEYTRYTREKHFRELSSRQQRQQLEAAASVAAAAAAAVAAAPIDRVKLQKEKAIESAASWNSSFNRERRDTRRACMDLQTYVVQVPKRYQTTQAQSKAKSEGATNYPVALVPGQFSEYYTTYTPEELACYPINTILLDPEQLKEIVSSERYRRLVAAEEARLQGSDDDSSSSSSDGSSDEDSCTSSSSSDEDDGGSSSDSSCTSSSSRSSTFSDCDHCDASGVKKELDRRKRTGMSVDCGKNDEISISTASGPPVRRSSRALSAGTVVVPPLVVETKDPTDSDDSDVPLIAHAVRKKNLQSSTNATAPPHPSAGGGKRMQEPVVSPRKRPPLDPFMCAVCLGPENKNRYSKPERFVRCNRCRRKAHPSCIGMSSVMYRRVQQYKWQCSECKLCMKCKRCPLATDSKMVYCDQCDRGYHLACKGLRNLPEGRWHCSICTICGQCGARTPEGHPNPHLNAQQRQHLAMVAEWTHEYGVNELTKIREHLRTLCVPCVRQRRQRLQQPDQASPIVTVVQQDAHGAGNPIVTSNCETKAILNNNNNPNDQRKQAQLSLPVQQQGVVAVGGMSGAGPAGSIKPQSQQYMINNSTTIKQQPHMMIVQTGSGIPNSHLQSGTKVGTMTGVGEIRR